MSEKPVDQMTLEELARAYAHGRWITARSETSEEQWDAQYNRNHAVIDEFRRRDAERARLAGEVFQWRGYAAFLLSCIASNESPDSFEVWQKKVSEFTNARWPDDDPATIDDAADGAR